MLVSVAVILPDKRKSGGSKLYKADEARPVCSSLSCFLLFYSPSNRAIGGQTSIN